MTPRIETTTNGQRIYFEQLGAEGMVEWAVVLLISKESQIISLQMNSTEVGIATWHHDFGLAQASLWHVDTMALPVSIGDDHLKLVAKLVSQKILPQIQNRALLATIEAFTANPFEHHVYSLSRVAA